jgi:hypothetical protein
VLQQILGTPSSYCSSCFLGNTSSSLHLASYVSKVRRTASLYLQLSLRVVSDLNNGARRLLSFAASSRLLISTVHRCFFPHSLQRSSPSLLDPLRPFTPSSHTPVVSLSLPLLSARSLSTSSTTHRGTLSTSLATSSRAGERSTRRNGSSTSTDRDSVPMSLEATAGTTGRPSA